MPFLDLPLPELRAYTGTNPHPADFDQYWNDALAETRADAQSPHNRGKLERAHRLISK